MSVVQFTSLADLFVTCFVNADVNLQSEGQNENKM